MTPHMDRFRCLVPDCHVEWEIETWKNSGAISCPKCRSLNIDLLNSDLEWCDDPDCGDPSHLEEEHVDLLERQDRGDDPAEFSETPAGDRGREKWARNYLELDGAPEGEWDR